MKICHQCSTIYPDDASPFCPVDGAQLVVQNIGNAVPNQNLPPTQMWQTPVNQPFQPMNQPQFQPFQQPFGNQIPAQTKPGNNYLGIAAFVVSIITIIVSIRFYLTAYNPKIGELLAVLLLGFLPLILGAIALFLPNRGRKFAITTIIIGLAALSVNLLAVAKYLR